MLKKGPIQRIATRSGALSLVIVAIAIAIGVASASGAAGKTSNVSLASGNVNSVVILLKDHGAGLSAHSAARTTARRAQESRLVQQLLSSGASHIVTGKAIPFVTATISQAQEAVLKANPSVQAVFPNAQIQASLPYATAGTASFAVPRLAKKAPKLASPPSAGPCGTSESPEQDPEALSVINAPLTNAYDGAGVKVAYIAGSIDTTIDDFQRNPAYASTDFGPGDPVVTDVNFTGDPSPDDQGGGASIESFLDASSIASQGNDTWNLSDFVNSSNPLPSNCDITVTGDAPGATVTGLDVFSNDYATTTSNFIQAIDYAVNNGIQVLNESFGSNNFPDTALDATRIADDDAVAAGVTVVVSSGDAGVSSTLGSPSTDPKLISVGATTTFRSYLQDTFGGINASDPNASNGNWLDSNISSLSSGGFSQGGATVDLVAPGDLNWIDCSTNDPYPAAGCKDDNGNNSGILLEGGTSESAPLTSGAAADVIQAYEETHHGSNPSPALIKQILMSTATDISSPAEQQGAGLLNIQAAVNEASSINSSTHSPIGSLLLSPNQVDITQPENVLGAQTITIQNNGASTQKVNLSTRTLTKEVAYPNGYVCLNPTNSDLSGVGSNCNGTAPTTDTFTRENGFTQAYVETTFTVPKEPLYKDRLDFQASTPYTEGSVVKIALYDPNGNYAGYSQPQGVGDHADIQISNPTPGTWTAVFFDTQNNSAAKGEIDWEADTWIYGQAGTVTPNVLTIAPGHTGTAVFRMRSPYDPGDAAQSIVVRSAYGTSTIPVVVRTLVPTGGDFFGTVTGGNGRSFPNPAQSNTYAFNVPQGRHDVEVEVCFEDYYNAVIGYLVSPEGQAVASSSNYTLYGGEPGEDFPTECLDVYKDNPEKGQWQIVLDYLQPVSGDAIYSYFEGYVSFNQVELENNLPTGTTHLTQNTDHIYYVDVYNNSDAFESIFLDPRTNTNTALPLLDQNGNSPSSDFPLPVGPPDFFTPLWEVPPDTTEIDSSLSSTLPVTYDTGPYFGDPDLSPNVAATGVVESQSGDSASLEFTPTGGEVAPGLWYMNPSEFGPYDSSGATSTTATASATAHTPAFDPTVTTESGDLWQIYDGSESFGDFSPAWLPPGCSAEIGVDIKPTATVGTHVTGTIKVDDAFQVDYAAPELFGPGSPYTYYGDAQEMASLPFSYTVS
ncbi:MAG TPA: S8 family serine peptidase [Gaiellaceae bacterium]|nr:S8 family serine peptidase [Gaiellaceae bacterium]